MEKKWYLQTWFICLLFLFWFAYGIPLILGIVLLALKLKQEKAFYSQFEQLTTEVNHIKELFAPEMQELHKLQELVDSLHAEEISTKSELENAKKAAEKDIQKKKAEKYILEKDIIDKKSDINILEREIAEKKKQVVLLDDEILVQEFGLYKPQFDFASALDYKEALAAIRANQKELIKNKQAVTGNTNWQVNGSASKGKKMVSDTQKLLLRAFNSECDELVSKVKYTNFDASLDKIYKSAETISKLGTIMDIAITQQYLSAKVKELRLAFEYQTKKQQEKEAQKAARAEQREQAKIQKELDEQRGN